ncbi:hypothetical protein CQ10_22620 [Bradyrhizobium valentinum]|uniref:Uncharacterized protein n=1 Tax=Bradyrhizobium valentinum TaxID=1518501 RepID=A0A0R3KYC4_9BRAD|nr:hypothetical protein CP49_16455 [Bradyrhizobium valentinum]KRR00481.1 hypothetical protein CQ10_22620 [Bradyrhizobium valentinum]
MRRSVRRTAGLGRDAAHEFVGMQTALHQHLALGLVDQFDSLGGGRLAVSCINNLDPGDFQLVPSGGAPDLGFRATRIGRMMPAPPGAVECATQ